MAHNAHLITLVKRNPGTFENDRFIQGDTSSMTIRGYLFPTGRKIRSFNAGGEITDNIITIWVSNIQLASRGVEITTRDQFVFDGNTYKILSFHDVDNQNRVTQYDVQKTVGFVAQ